MPTNNEAAASEKPDSRSSNAPEVTKGESTLDAVRRISGATTQKPAAPASKDDAAPEPKVEGKDQGAERKAATEEEPEGGWIPDEDLIGKDLRNVDLRRVRPLYRETVKKMQTAERKKHEKLDGLIAQHETKKLPTQAREEPEEEDDPYLDELRQMLKTKKGKALIREVLQEEGLDFDAARESAGDRILNRAITSATERYPELAKDKAFFDDTIRAIAEDEELASDFGEAEKNRDSKALARILREAAANVRNERADKERKRVAKEKSEDKATRDERTVETPGSRAAKVGRKSPVTDGPLSTLEQIKRVREQLES